MTDVTKLLKLKEDYDSVMNQINTLHAQARSIKLQLEESCAHPTTVRKSKHYEGGYDYTAETQYWDECTLCGEKLNYSSKQGGYG